jgi:aquaporin Z
MARVTAANIVGEFVGTYLLVFTVGCNVLSKTPVWAGVSIACVLMVAIFALGGVSGANFNPAVSVCLAITNSMKGPGGMDWGKCAIYCVTQIIAGILAAFSYAILFWNAFNLAPTKGFGWFSAGLCEVLYTFMLCFVVLNVAVARKFSENEGNQWYGLAIGFVIVAGAYGAGVVSGGCFNPAVAIGIDTSSAGLGFGWCVAYTIFELIGAALAALAFKAVRPLDFNAGDPFAAAKLGPKLVSEFLGTFMLVLTVGLNVLGNSPAGAFSIAASLMCMIYALGDVSGAHFNPAVTLAIFIAKLQPAEARQSPKEMGLYMAAQIIGGIVAACTYSLIYAGKTFPLGPQPGFKWWQAGVAEVIFTFTLAYVVLCAAVSSKTASKDMFGLAIGSCVTVGGFAIGSISGGSLNPAVSFGIATSHAFNGGNLWPAVVYTGYEFIGAGLAAGIAMATHAGGKDSA